MGLATLFRSMMIHPEAASVVRTVVTSCLEPLTTAIDADHARMRGSLVAAILHLLSDLLRPRIRALVNPDRQETHR